MFLILKITIPKGRLFLVNLERKEVFDEHPAEGIAGLRWSFDSSKPSPASTEPRYSKTSFLEYFWEGSVPSLLLHTWRLAG